nr:serine carboxypeptidase-like 13 [Ipomoea batatas]
MGFLINTFLRPTVDLKNLPQRHLLVQEEPLMSNVDYHRLSNYWANDPSVQNALHVRKDSSKKWTRCNWNTVSKTYEVTVQDTRLQHAILNAKGYRSLIYRMVTRDKRLRGSRKKVTVNPDEKHQCVPMVQTEVLYIKRITVTKFSIRSPPTK